MACLGDGGGHSDLFFKLPTEEREKDKIILSTAAWMISVLEAHKTGGPLSANIKCDHLKKHDSELNLFKFWYYWKVGYDDHVKKAFKVLVNKDATHKNRQLIESMAQKHFGSGLDMPALGEALRNEKIGLFLDAVILAASETAKSSKRKAVNNVLCKASHLKLSPDESEALVVPSDDVLASTMNHDYALRCFQTIATQDISMDQSDGSEDPVGLSPDELELLAWLPDDVLASTMNHDDALRCFQTIDTQDICMDQSDGSEEPVGVSADELELLAWLPDDLLASTMNQEELSKQAASAPSPVSVADVSGDCLQGDWTEYAQLDSFVFDLLPEVQGGDIV